MTVGQDQFLEVTPPGAALGAPGAPGAAPGAAPARGGAGGNVIAKAKGFVQSFQNAATEERRVAMDIVINGVQQILTQGGGGPEAAGAPPTGAGPGALPTAVPGGPGPQQGAGRPPRPALA